MKTYHCLLKYGMVVYQVAAYLSSLLFFGIRLISNAVIKGNESAERIAEASLNEKRSAELRKLGLKLAILN